MEAVTVESYAGSKAEEYPLRFLIHGREINISRIIDRWLTPGCRYFKVLAEDGNVYVLKYEEISDSWNILTTKRP